jgi:uncharacterized repeat protein (TIGR03837 family)
VDNPGVKTGKLWDIFCKVIDNYGDAGVCWRLASQLAARGERVRLWLDDPSPLAWMAPHGDPGVEIRRWTEPLDLKGLLPGDVLVEAFGCDIAPEFIALYASHLRASSQPAAWINLEYLSAERWAERNHGLASPVMSGPGKGLSKHFYYPGFTHATGGLLREPALLELQARFDRQAWLQAQGIEARGERLVSLFCYEPPALGQLLALLKADAQPTRLLVTSGRAQAAVQHCLAQEASHKSQPDSNGLLSISYLPSLTQPDFDHLLWACDLNFVRGEDSLVRALLAGKPLVWQIYPQDDDAHHAKLVAFLDWLGASPSLHAFHASWNSMAPGPLPALALGDWGQTVTQARLRLLQQDDLVSRLLRFISKNH